MRTLSIIGTRPETIKMAPVIHALENNPEIESIVCLTGQHREMLFPMLKLFGIAPHHDLDIMKKNQTLHDVTTQVLMKLKPILEKEKPDVVLVQGDTTSAFAASLAAYYQNIPVAHVEAGLRSYNIRSPFPEEINRRFVSGIAQWHFAPTEVAKKNLLSENVDSNTVYVTGNTVIDALLWTKSTVVNDNFSSSYGSAEAVLCSDSPVILVTGHRRESFGEGFENLCSALNHLAKKHPDWNFVYPVHLNPNVRSPVYKHLSDVANIHLIPPLDYAPFVQLMDRSKLIITDSGGIQEEAPSLDKPVLITRAITERPEAVEAGTALIVGTDFDRIVRETESLMTDENRYAAMVGMDNPYGDGQAASRIIDILKRDLSN